MTNFRDQSDSIREPEICIEDVFIAPKNWEQEYGSWRNRRFRMTRYERALEDSKSEDRPMTKAELIAFGKSVMANDEVYAGFLRVGEKGELTERESVLFLKFIEYYGFKLADRLPRHIHALFSLAPILRMFGSGTFRDWTSEAVIKRITLAIEGSEKVRKSAELRLNEILARGANS